MPLPILRLHDQTTVLCAPSVVVSSPDGQLLPDGAQGWFHGDRRVLSHLELHVGTGTIPVGSNRVTAGSADFHSAVTEVRSKWGDPLLLVRRSRIVSADGLVDLVEITNHGTDEVSVPVRMIAASDRAGVDAVKAGRITTALAPDLTADRVGWIDEWGGTTLSTSPPGIVRVAGNAAEATWHATVLPGSTWTLELCFRHTAAKESTSGIVPARRDGIWSTPHPAGDVSAQDLMALLLADPWAPDDVYAAAGSPWYLTLFGRDSLWTASLLLPLGTTLAAGTLRTLARRQGRVLDARTEEAPGKILHELRPHAIDTGEVQLAERYFGTIDATALWVRLLHDAWRAGMSEDEVRDLLPALLAAMEWITGPYADPDGDGLLEYAGSTTGGLTNQGWKDSHDGVRHVDGAHPVGPLALCEVQGYAHAAAQGSIALAQRFSLPGAQGWQEWARQLRERFHATFWVTDQHGHYPAIALDGDKKPVHGATSNMGHLLGTGILDPEQAALVARRLAAPDLRTPLGLRTLSTASRAFNPLSYHCGSVWPHDTAIAMTGLAAEGYREQADDLARSLVRAAQHFGGRVPELFGVAENGSVPLFYPAACAPQAWSAAAVMRATAHLAGIR